MSSIERMEYVNISGPAGLLDRTLRAISDSGSFHIEPASKVIAPSEDSYVPHDDDPYAPALAVLADISSMCGIKYSEVPCDSLKNASLQRMFKTVNSIKSRIAKKSNDMQYASDRLNENEQALTQVEHLMGLDVDIRSLMSCTSFDVSFGKLPNDSYEKLSYYEDKSFVFVLLSKDDEYCWGVYFSPLGCAKETARIFDSLYYERVEIPSFVHGKAEDAVKNIREHIEKYTKRRDDAQKALDELIKENKSVLCEHYTRLTELHELFALRSKAVITGDRFDLVGFVPKRSAEDFRKAFGKLPEVGVMMKPSDKFDAISPPIKLRNGRLAEPFGMFVEMYGLPSYDGINPTTLVALTYTLLFGIMFGDLGQGICVCLLGLFLWKKKNMRLGAVMTRLGVSSAIFGTLFGSVFGTEELLVPVYRSMGIDFLPFRSMENINTVLYGAIGIGVAIIVISMLVNIVVKFRQKDFESSVFSNNGICGLVFFCALIFGVVSAFMGKNVMKGLYVPLLIILPLILMFFREPLGCAVAGKKFRFENGIGDFIASNFFECFEFFLGYATNTLSFVRVGGFVLSHAGMMAVVISLTEIYPHASPVIMVLGNIFVMCLEGLLSGIQVLRLEFYEIFSRFYDGSGRPFVPVKVNFGEHPENT